jgi:hypothetical protein
LAFLANQKKWKFAAEKCPQGLKPAFCFATVAARLNSLVKKAQFL